VHYPCDLMGPHRDFESFEANKFHGTQPANCRQRPKAHTTISKLKRALAPLGILIGTLAPIRFGRCHFALDAIL
jgi:hypothetical protein